MQGLSVHVGLAYWMPTPIGAMYTSTRHRALQRLLQELGFRQYKPLQDTTPQRGLSDDNFGRLDRSDHDAAPHDDWNLQMRHSTKVPAQEVSLAFKAGYAARDLQPHACPVYV